MTERRRSHRTYPTAATLCSWCGTSAGVVRRRHDHPPAVWPNPNPSGNFAPDLVRDGQSYSFTERMVASIHHINTRLPRTDAGAQDGFTFVCQGGPYRGDINAQTNTVVTFAAVNPTPGVFDPPSAVTYRLPRVGGGSDQCLYQDDSNSRITGGYIIVPGYAHWHTAEVRGPWENCLTRTARADNYLCSKNWDFQSTYTHEMMHILGLGHTNSVDVPGCSAISSCDAPMVTRPGGNPEVRVSDPAMTCFQTGPPYLFTTARRTYSHGNAYDNDALQLKMRNRIS